MVIPFYFVYKERAAVVEMSVSEILPRMSCLLSIIISTSYRFRTLF